MDTAILTQQIESFFRLPKERIERDYVPYLYTFYERVFKYPRRIDFYRGFARHVLNETRSRGKRVLDIGCGFGLFSLYLIAEGAAEVVAVDVNEEKIDILKKMLNWFDPPPGNLTVLLGDGASLGFGDKSFDAVLAREVLSHAHNTDHFLREVNRVLKPGGYALIADGNNALDPMGRRFRRSWWERNENGPIDPKTLRGTDLPYPYSEIRRMMIAERFPDLSEADLALLVRKTAGLWGEEIYTAADAYLTTGTFHAQPEFRYRNPRTGEYPELELHPLKLTRQLHELGFQVKLIPTYWIARYPSRAKEMLYGTAMNTLNSLKPFHLLVSLFSPMFEILVWKVEDCVR